MAMQISVDPNTLTTEQRVAVADFILNYPAGHSVGKLSVDVTADTSKLKAAIAEIQDSTGATISQDDLPSTGAPSPVEAFGGVTHTDPAAAAAFGGAAAPLPPGANVAPFTAAAAPSLTAPAAMPAISTSPAASLTIAPQSVPAAPIAAAPAQPGPASVPGVELDKNGLPWDGRIHSEGKNKIADGSWRKKRGVDATLVATVEAELRAVMQAPAVPTAVPSAPAAPNLGNVPLPPGFPTAPAVTPSALAASPQTAMPAAAVHAQPADNGQDPRAQFVALVGRASAAIQGGKVTQAEVNQCCVNAGVPALPLLANRLDLVATVAASVDALIISRG